MSKVKDLTGQRFGKLVVTERDSEHEGRVHWLCQCDCGEASSVCSEALVGGNTKSCGCLRRAPNPGLKDLVGQRFGRLVVIERAVEDEGEKKGRVHWWCRCDCGKTTSVRAGALTSGNTQGCGCGKKARSGDKHSGFKDLAGRRFGKLVVLERDAETKQPGRKRTRWWCQCDCGTLTSVAIDGLVSDNTRSCGCGQGGCRAGEDHPGWKGGRVNYNGYVYVRDLTHPNRTGNGYVAEHRVVMERHVGRLLAPEETVHHVNGIKNDNRLENLELWASAHPRGQRVSDLLNWAHDIMLAYGDVMVTTPIDDYVARAGGGVVNHV